MNRNNVLRVFVFLLAVTLPVLCFAEYKVVIKKNGKILEGRLLSDTETSVTIVSGGAHITFKKADLDLDKMKELNADYHRPSDAKTVIMNNESAEPAPQQPESSPLADLAKQGTKNKDADSSAKPTDVNEKAFQSYIEDLDRHVKEGATEEKQRQALIDLGTAKKGYSNYRARNSRALTKTEQITMLEEWIKSLEFNLEKNFQAEASDEKIASLKKEIAAKKDELKKLQR